MFCPGGTFRLALPFAVDHALSCDEDVFGVLGGVFYLARDGDRIIVDHGVSSCCVKAAAIFGKRREQLLRCVDSEEAKGAGDQIGHALTELEAVR